MRCLLLSKLIKRLREVKYFPELNSSTETEKPDLTMLIHPWKLPKMRNLHLAHDTFISSATFQTYPSYFLCHFHNRRRNICSQIILRTSALSMA